MTVALQVPLSMGFPRQEYWSRLPFPSQEILANPGMEPVSPALQVDFFYQCATWEAPNTGYMGRKKIHRSPTKTIYPQICTWKVAHLPSILLLKIIRSNNPLT